VRYQGDPDFNSRNWLVNPTDQVPDDTLTITIDDLGNTDILNRDGDDDTGVPPRTASATVTIIVNPKQDTPEIVVVPETQVVNEDTVLELPMFEVFDVDARSRDTYEFDFEYDPDWQGKVTITVLYGTVWLDDPTGVAYSGGGTREITFIGGLEALNIALKDGNVRYQGDPDFNSRNWLVNPTDNVPNDTLTITIDDLGSTDILNRDGDDETGVPARTASATVTIIVNPKQDDPEIVVVPPTQVVDEDTVLELPMFEVFDVDARSRPTDPNAFEYDPDWQGTVTITVLYGSVWLHDSSGVVYAGGGSREISLTGGLDALNHALRNGNVRYQGDPDFNSRNWLLNPTDNVPDDTLTITIDDLANTDILNRDGDDDTGVPSRTASATVTIIVNPKQDTPEIVVVPETQVAIEDTVLELPMFEVFDVDARSRDSYEFDFEYDPDWQGKVTITVLYGTVWLDDSTGVAYSGGGTREITFIGGLEALNIALREGNVRYQGDPDFNSRNWLVNPTDNVPNDTLTITIDDLGSTDILNRDGDDETGVPARTASATVTIIVNPKQDDPEIVVVPPTQVVNEDTVLELPMFEVFDVDARSRSTDPNAFEYDPDWQGTVTITVLYGSVWLHDPSGVEYAGDRTREISLTGGLDALNHALRSGNVRYQGDPDFNSRNWLLNPTDNVPDDTLTITIDDLGSTDILNRDGDDLTGVPARTASATVTIIVNPKQDAPEITLVPPPQAVNEDTVLELPGFQVFDVDARSRATDPHAFEYDPDWQGMVTISVLYGTLWLDDADGVDYSGGGTREITFVGGLDALNQALREGNVRYLGDPDYNSGNPRVGNVEPDVLTITIHDLWNTDIVYRQDSSLGAQNPAGDGWWDSQTVQITVLPKQDAPTIPTVPPAQQVNEDTTLALPAFEVFDVDARSSLRDWQFEYDPAWVGMVTISVLNGTVWLHDPSGVAYTGDRTREITLTGSLDALNHALRAQNVRYQGDLDYNSWMDQQDFEPDVLTIVISDLGNTDIDLVDPLTNEQTKTVLITVFPVNDPPLFVELPGPQIVNEDQPLVFSAGNSNAIVIADPDVLEHPDGQLRVTLSVSHGTLTLSTVDGLTFPLDINGDGVSNDTNGNGVIDDQEVLGIGFNRITMFGSPEDINAALEGMAYQGFLYYNGPDQLVIVVNDQGYTGQGGPRQITGTVNITVVAVNTPPTVVIPVFAQGYEDTNLSLPGIVVGDPDERDGVVTLQVTLQVTQGILTVNTNVPGGISVANGNGSGTVVLIGSPARINQTLAHPTGLVYRGNLHYNDYSLDRNSTPNEVLWVTVNDRGNIGIGGVQEVSASATISILPINDAPLIQSTTQRTISEDAQNVFIPMVVQDVDADENPKDPLAAVTVTLRLTNAQGQPLTTGGTLAVLDGITGGIQNGVNGRILGNGTASLTISGSPVAITNTFAAMGGVHYIPAASWHGSLRLVATVEDHGNTDYRTNAPSLSHTVTVTINVTSVNDPPIALPQTVQTLEDQAVGITLTGDDGDPEVVQVLTFTLVTAPSHGTLTGFNPATGAVTYTPHPDFNGTDSFTFTVTDDHRAGSPPNLTSAPGTVTITVVPVNKPPVAHPQSVTTAEDQPVSITLTGADGDPEVNQVLTFTITTPPQYGTLGLINQATGAVTYTPGPDFNGTDSFAFTVTDDASAGQPANLTSLPATVLITVTPVNKRPVAHPQTVMTDMGAATVITLTGDDRDPEVVQVLTFAILDGPNYGTLSNFDPLAGTVLYTPNPDFAGTDTFTFTVTDDDRAGSPPNLTSVPGTVTINVTLGNRAPVAHPQSVTTAEDVAKVITLTGDDGNPEVVQVLTFTIVTAPTSGTLTGFDSATGVVTYTPHPDFNGTDSFTFTVTDDDQAGDPPNLTSPPGHGDDHRDAGEQAADRSSANLDDARRHCSGHLPDRRRRRSGGGSGVDLYHHQAAAVRDARSHQPDNRRGDVHAQPELQRSGQLRIHRDRRRSGRPAGLPDQPAGHRDDQRHPGQCAPGGSSKAGDNGRRPAGCDYADRRRRRPRGESGADLHHHDAATVRDAGCHQPGHGRGHLHA
jgi:hypothetical protein